MQQKFELVELNQPDSQEIDDFESGRNAFGIDRIIEALQAHTWPNMKLKGKRIYISYLIDIIMYLIFSKMYSRSTYRMGTKR